MKSKRIFAVLLLIGFVFINLYGQDTSAENGNSIIVDNYLELSQQLEEVVKTSLKENRLSAVDSLFSEVKNQYFEMLKSGNSVETGLMYNLMRKVFNVVPSLADDLLYVDCKKYARINDWNKVALTAEKLLSEYPNSEFRNRIIRFYKFSYLERENSVKYIELCEKYPDDSAKANYFKGQAYYNLGIYDEALKCFQIANEDLNYSLRSYASIGLIEIAKGNYQEALDNFDAIAENFAPSTPYYEFAVLSIARLSSYLGYYDAAIQSYSLYINLNGTASNEIVYEIGLTYRNAGETAVAKDYFDTIIDNQSFAGEYYILALYNRVVIELEESNEKKYDKMLVNYGTEIDNYFRILINNRNLMYQLKNTKLQIAQEKNRKKRDALVDNIREKETLIIANRSALENQLSYLDDKTVNFIKDAELSFIEKNETFLLSLDLAEANNEYDKEVFINNADYETVNIAERNKLHILSELFTNIDEIEDSDYVLEVTYDLIDQLYPTVRFLSIYKKGIAKAKKSKTKRKFEKAYQNDRTRIENILYSAEADSLYFANNGLDQETFLQVMEKYTDTQVDREFKVNRIYKNLFKKRTRKDQIVLAKDYSNLEADFDPYFDVFNHCDQIKKTQKIFLQYVRLDYEYKEIVILRQKEIEQAKLDTTIYELTDNNLQKKVLYNKIENFIQSHPDFNYNWRLYFDMAELSTTTRPYNRNYDLVVSNYAKAVELNPKLENLDAALYNIAYYEKLSIDLKISKLKGKMMKDRDFFAKEIPESVLHTEDKYSRVIDNYQQLAKDESTEYRFEARWNLANLYWELAIDGHTEHYLELIIEQYEYLVKNDVKRRKKALYQLGWYKMASGDYYGAISAYKILLAYKDEFTDDEKVIFDPADDVIAYCLYWLDSDNKYDNKFASVEYIKDSLAVNFDEETFTSVFNQVMGKKKNFHQFEHQIKMYEAWKDVHPLAIQAPVYTDSIINVYTNSKFARNIGKDSVFASVKNEYFKVYKRYDLNSEWYKINEYSDSLSKYVGIIQKALEGYIIPSYFKSIKKEPTFDTISKYRDIVNDYAEYKGFDENIRKAKLLDYDANSMWLVQNYVIDNPDTTTYNYGMNEIYSYIARNSTLAVNERSDLERNAYSYANNSMKMVENYYREYEEKADSLRKLMKAEEALVKAQTIEIDTTAVISDSLTIVDSNLTKVDSSKVTSLASNANDSLNFKLDPKIDEIIKNSRVQYINAANRLENYLASVNDAEKEKDICSIYVYRGLAKREIGDIEGATEDFLACDKLNIPKSDKLTVSEQLAEIYLDNKEFDIAKDYYRKAKQYADQQDKIEYDKKVYNTSVAHHDYSLEIGDKLTAAKITENEIATSKVIDKTQREAARQIAIREYSDGGDLETAINRLLGKANEEDSPAEAWNYYGNAINHTNSLGQNDRTVKIQDEFIQRFPAHFQTFTLLMNRIKAVSDTTLITYNEEKAAELYMDIYNRSTAKKKKLDISSTSNKPEDFYWTSIDFKNKILTKEGNKRGIAENLIAFNKKFPDYNPIPIVTRIALIYQELTDEVNFPKWSLKLLKYDKKDPKCYTLYLQYASNELSKVNMKIVNSHKENNWNVMLNEIKEFEKLSSKFLKDGLTKEQIMLKKANNVYATFKQDYQDEKDRKAFLAKLDKDYEDIIKFTQLDTNNKNRLRVNINTRWTGNIVGKGKRIEKYQERFNAITKRIQNQIKLINSSKLLQYYPEEKVRQTFRLQIALFEILDYSENMYDVQLTKYRDLLIKFVMDVKRLIQNVQDGKVKKLNKYDKENLKRIKSVNALLATKDISKTRYYWINYYQKNKLALSKKVFNNYLDGRTKYYDGNEIIVDYLKEQNFDGVIDTESYPLGQINSTKVIDANITQNVFSDSTRVFEMYTIPVGKKLDLGYTINADITPFKSLLRFVDEGNLFATDVAKISYKINGKECYDVKLVRDDGELKDTTSVYPYLRRTVINNYQGLKSGVNKIEISIENVSKGQLNVGLTSSIEFNKEKLYMERNSIRQELLSNLDWRCGDIFTDIEEFSDSLLVPVVQSKLPIGVDYTQYDEFKSITAMPIWDQSNIQNDSLMVVDSLTTKIDSTKITDIQEEPVSKIFVTRFNLEGKVLEATLFYLAKDEITVWLNGEMIAEEETMDFFDAPETPNIPLESENFIEGENVMIIQVNSPTKISGLMTKLKIKSLKKEVNNEK